MKKTTIGTIILATSLSFAGISYAIASDHQMNKGQNDCHNRYSESGKHMGRGSMNHRGMGFAKLDLTDLQKQEMKTIMASSHGKNRQLVSASERALHQEQMQALISNEIFDEEKATALINQRQSKHSEIALQMLKNKHQMYQLLTDQQKEQYNQNTMKFHHR